MNRHWSTKHKNITCAEDTVLIADNEQEMQNVVIMLLLTVSS